MAPESRRPGTPDRPLRVLVIGSSVVFMMVPPRSGPDDRTYGELLPELLLDRGIVATTAVHSRWHTTVREVLPHFEPWVRDHFPDVVIVNLGMAECQARVVPTWLYRNTVTWAPGLSGGADWYRRHIVPTLRRAVRRWQRRTVASAPMRMSRVPPAPFERAMTRLARLCNRDLGALVLLLDIDPPGERVLHWQPGLDRRVARYNAILQRVAEAAPGRTVVVPTSGLVKADPSRLLPDGLHRSADGHRLVAGALADVIAAHAAELGLSR